MFVKMLIKQKGSFPVRKKSDNSSGTNKSQL